MARITPYDDAIQKYLDAVGDPGCSCNGNMIGHIAYKHSEPPSYPNCQVRHQCQLYRKANSRTQRAWYAVGDYDKGCDPYQFWQQEKKRQEEDSREWIVEMAGHEMLVEARDVESAAVTMFLTLRDLGISVPKEYLLDREYKVREA
jgi:hypothetical protein